MRDHLPALALQEEGVVATAVAVEIPVASRQQGPRFSITQAENIIRGDIGIVPTILILRHPLYTGAVSRTESSWPAARSTLRQSHSQSIMYSK